MPYDLKPLEQGITRLSNELTGAGLTAMLRAIGDGAKGDVGEAVRRDIGDTSMSGWRRGRPVQIGGRYKIDGSAVVVFSSAAGPMRVLEDGRHHSGGGFQGPGVNRRTGATARTKAGKLRAVKASKGSRWNGMTRGKETWTEASALIAHGSVDRGEKVFMDIARKSLL